MTDDDLVSDRIRVSLTGLSLMMSAGSDNMSVQTEVAFVFSARGGVDFCNKTTTTTYVIRRSHPTNDDMLWVIVRRRY